MAYVSGEQISARRIGGWMPTAGAVGPTIASSLEAAPLAVIVDLVRTGRADTRPQLGSLTGLSRKVVAQRVEQACESGLLREVGLAPSGGGRQARRLDFNEDAGRVLGVLVEASEITVGISDLRGNLLDTIHEDWTVGTGPDATMRRVKEGIDHLASRQGVERPWGIGVGVPGPVDYPSGRLASPPLMPGWDGFSPRAWLREHYDAPTWVDNDVNLMALGEWAFGAGSRESDMLFIKAGTGVGAAIVSRGRLLRGQLGAAGEIGHIRVTDDPSAVCLCGETGCLEAVAGGWSLLAEATKSAAQSATLSTALAAHGRLALLDVGDAAREGDPVVLDMLLRRAQSLGEVAAAMVNFLNPGELVIGGGVLRAGSAPLDRVRDVVAARGTRLTTKNLAIRGASLDQLEGVNGAALLAIESLLSPVSLARWVEEGSPLGHAAGLQRIEAAFA